MLVTQQLTADNYALCSHAKTIALSIKNKLGFVDGSIPRLDDRDINILSAWTPYNNIVISWILDLLFKEIFVSILSSDSAFEIWIDLRDSFQQNNGPQIF